MVCPSCGRDIWDRVSHCPHCGARLDQTACQAPGTRPLSLGPWSGVNMVRIGRALAVGTVLDQGRYRIDRLLKAGSFGAVYVAMALRLGGMVCAIKELRPDAGQSAEEQIELERWFAREAALLMELRHRMIPEIVDRFSEGGRQYLVMDFIEGADLAEMQRVRQQPFAEAQVLGWGVALCDVLGYLHGLPVPLIFRDVKPANLVCTPRQTLMLVDFGIACRMNRPERTGTTIGTPGYAPLEQYQGQAEPRSDLYALGATLHTLLTGYDPEHAPPFSFPLARGMNPAVSPQVERLIERALSLKPEDRFADAAAMGAALLRASQAGYVEQTGVVARPPMAQTVPGVPSQPKIALCRLRDAHYHADVMLREHVSVPHMIAGGLLAGVVVEVAGTLTLLWAGIDGSTGAWPLLQVLLISAVCVSVAILWYRHRQRKLLLEVQRRLRDVEFLVGTFVAQFPDIAQSVGGQAALEDKRTVEILAVRVA